MTPLPDRVIRSVGITIRDLHKRYGAASILRNVSLDIPRGSFVALLGPSGCGKTTLLRTIAGLERADAGSIHIGDRAVVDVAAAIMVPPQQRRLGMVFQHYALWPHMTVRSNILYPLRKQRFPRAEWDTRVTAIAASVGLGEVLDRRPAQLSGGQQQRVALARALVSHPSVLLLDEPLSNLDANLRDQLRRELRQIHDRQGTTTILVTHDQEEAAMLADVIAVIDRGEIVQVGTPADILDRPRTRFVATFVGYGNFLDGVVTGAPGGMLQVRLAGSDTVTLQSCGVAPPPGAAVTVAVRGDRITLDDCEPAGDPAITLTGCVRQVQHLGRWREILVDYANTTLSLRELSAAARPMRPDQPVSIRFPATSPVLVA